MKTNADLTRSSHIIFYSSAACSSLECHLHEISGLLHQVNNKDWPLWNIRSSFLGGGCCIIYHAIYFFLLPRIDFWTFRDSKACLRVSPPGKVPSSKVEIARYWNKRLSEIHEKIFHILSEVMFYAINALNLLFSSCGVIHILAFLAINVYFFFRKKKKKDMNKF